MTGIIMYVLVFVSITISLSDSQSFQSPWFSIDLGRNGNSPPFGGSWSSSSNPSSSWGFWNSRPSCQRTKECQKFHICRNGQCWPSKPNNSNRRCSGDHDCPDNHIYQCISGQCKVPAHGTTNNAGLNNPSVVSYNVLHKSTSHDDGYRGVSCKNSKKDCQPFEICRKRQCWASNLGTGKPCVNNSNCPNRDIYKCDNKVCKAK